MRKMIGQRPRPGRPRRCTAYAGRPLPPPPRRGWLPVAPVPTGRFRLPMLAKVARGPALLGQTVQYRDYRDWPSDPRTAVRYVRRSRTQGPGFSHVVRYRDGPRSALGAAGLTRCSIPPCTGRLAQPDRCFSGTFPPARLDCLASG